MWTKEQKAAHRTFMLSIPWLTWDAKGKPCDGIRWREVPLKAIFGTRTGPPTGLDKYRCKRQGHWRFVARRIKDNHAKTGTYCYSHVWAQLEGDMVEHLRLSEHRKEYRA